MNNSIFAISLTSYLLVGLVFSLWSAGYQLQKRGDKFEYKAKFLLRFTAAILLGAIIWFPRGIYVMGQEKAKAENKEG